MLFHHLLIPLLALATCPSHGTDVNLALLKRARQSSTWRWADADKAVDGNYVPVFGDGSCSCTLNDPASPAWWRVDLGSVQTITSVEVTNAAGDFGIYLKNFEILVSPEPNIPSVGAVCSNYIYTVPAGESERIECRQPMTGRYVTIRKHIPGNLILCEVRVFGVKRGSTNKESGLAGVNLALNKPALQSSTIHGAVASLAVDGINGQICTRTSWNSAPWWRVDLLQRYSITSVRVTNPASILTSGGNAGGAACFLPFEYAGATYSGCTRINNNGHAWCATVSDYGRNPMWGNCLTNLLHDFQVLVTSGPDLTSGRVCYTRYGTMSAGVTETLTCDRPIEGRYVTIKTNDVTSLSLCEVQVFGTAV